jgi:hypothetical protein
MDLSRAIALDLSKFKVLALQPDPWPCLLDRSHLCITNHSFDILAHGSQTHTETWETFAGTPKRYARPCGNAAARLLECAPWTCNYFA